MSPKSFVKDVVRCLELVMPKSGRADAAGPSCSNAVSDLSQCCLVPSFLLIQQMLINVQLASTNTYMASPCSNVMLLHQAPTIEGVWYVQGVSSTMGPSLSKVVENVCVG